MFELGTKKKVVTVRETKRRRGKPVKRKRERGGRKREGEEGDKGRRRGRNVNER